MADQNQKLKNNQEPSMVLSACARDNTLVQSVQLYLREITKNLRNHDCFEGTSESSQNIVDSLFRTLTSRPFCYLGRSRSEPYREIVCGHIRRDVGNGEPVSFYYDVGPGYHASIDPAEHGPSFAVGLGELMLIRQVLLFCRQVERIYQPGARFHLVIDNLCALATNDIPVHATLSYVQKLHELLAEIGVLDRIALLVESEVIGLAEYQSSLGTSNGKRNRMTDPDAVSEAELDNVSRFLGRRCDAPEAARRIDAYRRAGDVTERLLRPFISGVRLTQRATPHTLGFRAFPGGDQRIQVGQVALNASRPDKMKPFLLTSRNAGEFQLMAVETGPPIPSQIGEVIAALPRHHRLSTVK